MVKEMNIYDIKNKANEVLRQPNQLFKVILYVGIIQALFSALSGLFDGILGSIISLILSILTVTLGHGIIVASLKVVNNNGNLVDEKEDSLVGIKRFGQLFPTYFLYRVVVALAGIVVGVIGMLLMYTMITDAQFSNLSQLVLMYVNKSTISQDEIVNIVASLSNVFSFVFILVIIISILSVYLSLTFGLFNYILQKYNYHISIHTTKGKYILTDFESYWDLHVKLLIADNYETEAKTPQCNNIRIDNVPFNANSFCCLQTVICRSTKEGSDH